MSTTTLRERSRVTNCENCAKREARIAMHATRLRERSRISTRQQAGQVRIEQVEVDPTRVSPGGTISVTVNLRETAEVVAPGPELCAPGGIFGSGIAVIVEVSGDWGEADDQEVCIPVQSLGTGRVNPTFTLQAPTLPRDISQETRTITTSIQIRGHENRTAEATQSITVSQEGRRQPRDRNGGGGGGGGPLLPCFIDPNRQCSPFEQLAFSGAAFFLVFLLFASR